MKVFSALALLSALLLGFAAAQDTRQASAAQDKIPTVKEPSSKVEFPVRTTAQLDGSTLHLMGTGLRTKTIFKVKVYAYGLYVDARGAQQHLAQWKGKEPKVIKKDRDFYLKLLNDNFTKSLRLQFTRNVDADDVADAFEGSLKPRIKKAKEKMKWTDGDAALKTFRGLFDIKKVKKGSIITMTWHPGSRLIVTVDGVKKPEIQSKTLCWALWDTFYGRDPISSSGKKSSIERVPAILDMELPPLPKPTPAAGTPPKDKKDPKGGR